MRILIAIGFLAGCAALSACAEPPDREPPHYASVCTQSHDLYTLETHARICLRREIRCVVGIDYTGPVKTCAKA